MRTSQLISAAFTVTATLVAGGGFASATTPDASSNDFLDTPALDAAVADAENGAPECAVQAIVSGVLWLGAIAGMEGSTTSVDLGDYPAEVMLATFAPVLVPLLGRAELPADDAAAATVGVLTGQLTAVLDEMRELGLTDDDLLALQSAYLDEAFTAAPSDSTPAEVPEQFFALVDHDFEAITLFDADGPLTSIPGGATDPTQLWAAECPETASMLDFDFDMDPVEVTMDASVVIGGSEPEGSIEVTVNGSEVPVETNG